MERAKAEQISESADTKAGFSNLNYSVKTMIINFYARTNKVTPAALCTICKDFFEIQTWTRLSDS